MLEINPAPSHRPQALSLVRTGRKAAPDQSGDKELEARVKPEWVHLYPGVDPITGIKAYWVTYILANHFEVQARPGVH